MVKAESDHSKNFTEKVFWKKVGKLALHVQEAGRSTICKVLNVALTLYFCLIDPETPLGVKAVIPAPLGYFIWPFDFVPDPIAGVGYADDWVVLLATLKLIVSHIKKDHIRKAKEKQPKWCENGEPITQLEEIAPSSNPDAGEEVATCQQTK